MVTIFFVIDGLSLEAHAALLAATLVHHNGNRFRYIGYVTERHGPEMNPALSRFLELCGVEIRSLPGPTRPWDKPYPHGNKILAALDRRDTGHSMFLDTDILCLGPLDLTPLMADRAIAVVPEGRRSWGSDLERWERVYKHFGLALPAERIQLSRNRDIQFVPYFNAGMILFPDAPLTGGQRFADLWYETALTIDHEVRVAKKRPWLDQIALPVTLKRFNLGFIMAPEALNYAAADRTLQEGENPLLLHYHRWAHLATWPGQRQAALDQARSIAGEALFAELAALYGEFWTAAPPVVEGMPEVGPEPVLTPLTYRYTILYVADVAATLAFYKAAFGFETLFLHEGGDYGELATGGTKLCFSSHDLMARIGKVVATTAPKKPSYELAFETGDVAAGLARAVAAGAALVMGVTVMPWGQTLAYVKAPEGTLIEICSPV